MYQYEEQKLYIFQVRSGLIKGRRDEFLDDVLAWCKERQVNHSPFYSNNLLYCPKIQT